MRRGVMRWERWVDFVSFRTWLREVRWRSGTDLHVQMLMGGVG